MITTSTPQGTALHSWLAHSAWQAVRPMTADGAPIEDRFTASPTPPEPTWVQGTLDLMPAAATLPGDAAAAAVPGPVGAALRLVLLGPPGSGKSTLGQILARERGIPHISVGDLVRQEIASGSERGRALAQQTEGGDLASPELVRDLVQDRLGREDASRGFILDGYPRQPEQLAEFRELDQELGWDGVQVVGLKVTEEEVTRRLEGRGRADDRPEVVRHRMEVYREETEPVMNYFRVVGEFTDLDASGPVDVVAARLRAVISGT